MNISHKVLAIGLGCSSFAAIAWLDPIQKAADKFSVNTPNRIAAFLANIGVETGGLTRLVENLYYSAQGLADTWPIRYSVDPHSARKAPNALALQLAGKPEQIANNVYANRLGNGDEASGDGWRNRGQGPIEITGRDNLYMCANAIGIDVLARPELLQLPAAGAMSAAWFFSAHGCNELADAGDIYGTVKHINGQLPCLANNGPLRIARYHACLDAIKAGA